MARNMLDEMLGLLKTQGTKEGEGVENEYRLLFQARAETERPCPLCFTKLSDLRPTMQHSHTLGLLVMDETNGLASAICPQCGDLPCAHFIAPGYPKPISPQLREACSKRLEEMKKGKTPR